MANSLALHKSKNFTTMIVRLLQTLQQMNLQVAPKQVEEFMAKTHQHIQDMAAWIWLFWLPQIIQLLFSEAQIGAKPKNTIASDLALNILERVAFFELPNKTLKPSIYS